MVKKRNGKREYSSQNRSAPAEEKPRPVIESAAVILSALEVLAVVLASFIAAKYASSAGSVTPT